MTTSGERLARLAPASLTEAQRRVYDEVAGGRRAQGPQLFRLVDGDGALEGPFNAFLLQPNLGAALQAVGSAVRFETSLSGRARELAILVVSAHWDSAFEWHAHEAVGRHVGLTDEDLAAVREQRWDAFRDAEGAVVRTTHLLVRDGDLDDDAYALAVQRLGEPGLFEILTLVGYYATLALQLRVFRVAAPTGGTA
jgi:4-carboxymuconolactone decarboxylase